MTVQEVKYKTQELMVSPNEGIAKIVNLFLKFRSKCGKVRRRFERFHKASSE